MSRSIGSEPAITPERSAPRRAFLALLAAWLLAVPSHAADRVALMRGVVATQGVSNFQWIGNEASLDRASLAGITGQQARDGNVENIRAQIVLYETAQRSRLGPRGSAEPLHILLDPNETWVYARWGHPFRVRYPDGRVRAPDTGFVHLGEQFDYSGRRTEAAEVDVAANRDLLARLDDWYSRHLQSWSNRELALFAMARAGPCVETVHLSSAPFESYAEELRRQLEELGCDVAKFDEWVQAFKSTAARTPVAFSTDVGGRFRYTLAGRTGGLEVYVEGLPHEAFIQHIGRLVEADLASRKPAPEVSWKEFLRTTGALERAERVRQDAAVSGINESFAHELGHMIQFEATGGKTGNTAGSGNPESPGSHSIRTLSNPAFALSEGWAEAMGFIFGGHSPKAAREVATRIDYADSLAPLRRHVNQLYLNLIGGRLKAKGMLAADGRLTVNAEKPLELPFDRFRQELRREALAHGMSQTELASIESQWESSPENRQLLSRLAYVEDLQAHQGEPKLRKDFLSSEASVSVALLGLHRDLGDQTFRELTETLARSRATSLAGLLEAYAHDHPARRVALYRSLAGTSEQILVTDAQAELIARNPGLEIDLDRDGRVPGRDARTAGPALFPPERTIHGDAARLLGLDPLAAFTATGQVAAGHEPSVPLEPEAVPEPRLESETVGFEGIERN